MTLQEISDLAGIPKRTVDDIFSGHTKNPRIDTIQAIERALGIGSGFTAEEIAAGIRATKREYITPIEDDLLYEFRKLSPYLQEFILKMVRTLNGSDNDTPPAASMANRA